MIHINVKLYPVRVKPAMMHKYSTQLLYITLLFCAIQSYQLLNMDNYKDLPKFIQNLYGSMFLTTHQLNK